MSEEKKNEGFLLGLAIGGLIGAAAAFMLDKEDSEKLKKLIKNKGKILLDSLEDVAEEGQERISDTVTEVKQQVEQKVQDLPSAVTEQATEVKENVVDKVEILGKSGKSSLRHFFVKAGKKLAK